MAGGWIRGVSDESGNLFNYMMFFYSRMTELVRVRGEKLCTPRIVNESGFGIICIRGGKRSRACLTS